MCRASLKPIYVRLLVDIGLDNLKRPPDVFSKRSSSQTFQLSCFFDVWCLVTTTSPSYQEIPDLWLLWLVWMDVSNTHVRDSSDWRGIQNYYFWERKSKRSSKFLLQMKKRLFVFAAGSTLVRFYAGEQHLEARRPWPTLNTQHFFLWKISTF